MRSDIETVLNSQCKEWRIEEGDDLNQVTKIFVDNDQVKPMTTAIRLIWSGPHTVEVHPINEEEEQPKEKAGPLEDVAKMLDIEMVVEHEGMTGYLQEIVVGRHAAKAKYGDTKPEEVSGADSFLSMLKEILSDRAKDCGCPKCVERRKVAENKEEDHY